MHCYCANYYGATHCQNKVTEFGQRCKLCTVLNEGRPAKRDLFKITSNDYAYDSEAVEEEDDDYNNYNDSSSSQGDDNSRRHSRDHSKSSSE
ncbi:hypothetical protein GGR53DRAFT_322660 [Hypoxylon sp. FL1150]|nr:hypothetical protein GGR53DRAFT_322660 [Hypoxylon sp. FL1150]